ncbi:hypothetical protein RhiirA4_483938 [Rhizophagus irregularis]|uniref:Uncharacterized protein n=1 Tax=Rhizophagus irregularis TaxID=588596 RepID=A0A2I1HN97_9GLOM|nr:hypothetical protein RhiirA4_483938 [Rhizophagus irregularis]
MSQKEKKGKQSARNPEDEVQNKSSRIIKRHPSRLLGTQEGAGRDVVTPSNRSKIPVTSDVERIRPNTRTTPGTQEGAGRDVVTPSNRPARSEIQVTPDVERIRPNTRSNTPGSVGRNTSSSSSLSSRSRIDNIKELQAKKPNIRLPSNLLNIFEKTDVAPPAEDLPTGNDEELKQQIYDLRIQNHQLERQNREFANQIETLKANITSLKDENEMLMSINEAFGQENEQLNDEIKRFWSFRIPRSLQSTQSSSQPRSSDKDLADGEDESSFHPVKRKRHKAKGKRIARNDDGEECDNEEARTEMKSILKTLPRELNLKVEETFASEVNTEIRRKLVPELLKAMKPRYNPSYDQLKSWLQALHKHRRSRYMYRQKGKIDKDDRRLHCNGRHGEKKARRIKGAKSLFEKGDERLAKYDKSEIYRILQDNDFHSPELSVTDDENPSLKHNINVYDLSWRSDELRHLLRNILDPYSLSLQSAQLTRPRNYNDAIYVYRQPPPANVPDWAYVEQNTAYETDFDNQNTPSDGGAQNAPSNISDVSNQKRLSHEERRILIDVNEEHQRGESSTHGEIRGALLQSIHEEQMIQRKAAAESGDDYAPLTDEDYGSEMIE